LICICVRVTLRCAARLVFTALWLLVEECRAETGAPSLAERVIWAVNSGGDAHTDAAEEGIIFPPYPEDQVLYQTERYNEDTFGYEIPIREEGDYILVMKYAEVYFAQSQQKVFDVRLNGHVVVKDLDIFDRVGHSTAHDEIVPFSIKRGKLSVHGEVSTFNGKLTVEFVKRRISLKIFCHIVTFTQFNASLLNKNINLNCFEWKCRFTSPLRYFSDEQNAVFLLHQSKIPKSGHTFHTILAMQSSFIESINLISHIYFFIFFAKGTLIENWDVDM
uniref:Malectin n=1 Tax=Cyprinus carpio TaxID=7962 RepID=A0A8C1MG37_CYPCA